LIFQQGSEAPGSLRKSTRAICAHAVRLSPLLGVLQNDAAPMLIDDPPFFDLLHGSKAAQTGIVIIQAAISYARGSSGAVDITH
jgi:hypothetical protein